MQELQENVYDSGKCASARRRKVYVVNKSAHDFSPAEEYGELVFLSEGPMNRYACNSMHRDFSVMMSESQPDDYIVPCSLNVMNSIACAIFARKHGRLNLLLFKEGRYIERNLVMEGGDTIVNHREDTSKVAS